MPVLEETRPGDVFVWINEHGREAPFRNFTARGARTVFYQTEHLGTEDFPHCDPSRPPMGKHLAGVDEVWSFVSLKAFTFEP